MQPKKDRTLRNLRSSCLLCTEHSEIDFIGIFTYGGTATGIEDTQVTYRSFEPDYLSIGM